MHKICLSCGYQLIYDPKPHGFILFQGDLKCKIHFSFLKKNIRCPLCRMDQTSCFPMNETRMILGFTLPNKDWNLAMTQRLQDVASFDPEFCQKLKVIPCVKCKLTFPTIEECMSHVTRCSEQYIHCLFCNEKLTPIKEETSVSQRLFHHLTSKCAYLVDCRFAHCKCKVKISKMTEHRKNHAQLLLLGEYISDGAREFTSLEQVPQLFLKPEKWRAVEVAISLSMKSRTDLIPERLIKSSHIEAETKNDDDDEKQLLLESVQEEEEETEEGDEEGDNDDEDIEMTKIESGNINLSYIAHS